MMNPLLIVVHWWWHCTDEERDLHLDRAWRGAPRITQTQKRLLFPVKSAVGNSQTRFGADRSICACRLVGRHHAWRWASSAIWSRSSCVGNPLVGINRAAEWAGWPSAPRAACARHVKCLLYDTGFPSSTAGRHRCSTFLRLCFL